MKKLLITILILLWSSLSYGAGVLDMTADTSPTSDDIIYVINDPVGTPSDRKVSLGNLWKGVLPDVTGKGLYILRVNSGATGYELTNSLTGTLTQTKYVWLTSPMRCDETGALIDTTKTNATYGQCQFSNSADKAGNYAIYKWAVPPDIDTTIDLTARIYFRLGGADTGKHAYEISLAAISSSASANGSFGNAVNMFFAGDASGASGDLEVFPAEGSAATTLTDWKSAVTPNQMILIKLARDGDDGTNDTSTVNSFTELLVISYGSTQ